MKIKNLLMFGCAALILASCGTPKSITYFPDTQNGEVFSVNDVKGITLKPGDKLSIIVHTKSIELNNVLNMPVTSQVIGYQETQSLYQSQGTSGYTIDAEGNIDFPLIGTVKAEGKTRPELAASLKQILTERQVAIDAVVTVEYMNLGYSVLGEVRNPGYFKFTTDKCDLLQALSRAGDLLVTGKRGNVKVIRTIGDKQETYVIDMQDQKAMVASPGYYIQQNDVIYVEPNDYKKRQATANANQFTNPSFWLSAISVLTTIAVLIFK
jgi:polysaccharide export outer membrane protein